MVIPDFRIHNVSHIVKSILGFLEFLLYTPKYNKGELIVVNYHGTPAKFFKNFKKQVDFLTSIYQPLKASEIDKYFNGELSTKGPFILFTFDDGLKNNLQAANYLAEKNISAFFFVVPSFIETLKDDQARYYKTHIRPIINSHIESKEEDITALSWNEIKELINSGHCVGCHTRTHTLISNKSTADNSIFEIETSKKLLEDTLANKVDSFCSINNTLISIGKKEKHIISENYKYHFTTIPGYNNHSNPLFIKRRNIESFWLPGAVKLSVGKLDLRRWKKHVSEYDSYHTVSETRNNNERAGAH
jgi:peptidoglycan/xylan/chitin deacetylase (PgdA/CDA1 family)